MLTAIFRTEYNITKARLLKACDTLLRNMLHLVLACPICFSLWQLHATRRKRTQTIRITVDQRWCIWRLYSLMWRKTIDYDSYRCFRVYPYEASIFPSDFSINVQYRTVIAHSLAGIIFAKDVKGLSILSNSKKVKHRMCSTNYEGLLERYLVQFRIFVLLIRCLFAHVCFSLQSLPLKLLHAYVLYLKCI